MKPSKICRWMVLGASLLLVGYGPARADEQYSGFLKDYSGLEKTKDPLGNPLMRFASPQLTPANYHAMIVEPVQLFPEPKPSDKVSAATLEEIVVYINEKLRDELKKYVEVTETPGPGVGRLRVAVTGVGAKKEGLKPYQYIPVALVLTAVTRTVEGAPEEAKLYVESEVTDSLSGNRLLIGIRSGTGKRLKEKVAGTDVVTLDTLKPLIDEWIDSIAKMAPMYFQTKGS